MQQNVFISLKILELKKQLAEITKRKSCKKKRIQHSKTVEYSAGALYVAAEASAASQLSKKAYSSSSKKQALLA